MGSDKTPRGMSWIPNFWGDAAIQLTNRPAGSSTKPTPALPLASFGQRLCCDLTEHAGNILLVKRACGEVTEEPLSRHLRRVSHLNVAVRWRGREAVALVCIASPGNALVHLEISTELQSDWCRWSREAGGRAGG
eukprot:2995323-Rhodomonas_salina.2